MHSEKSDSPTDEKVKTVRISDLPKTDGADFHTIYANHLEVGALPDDIRILFGSIDLKGPADSSVRRTLAVNISPRMATELHKLLGEKLRQWDKSFAKPRAEFEKYMNELKRHPAAEQDDKLDVE